METIAKSVGVEIIPGVPTIKISKKELTECSNVRAYTGGGRKKIALFFDAKSDPDSGRWLGYKFMFVFTGLTKREVITASHEILTTGNSPALADLDKQRIAVTDAERFKVPLSL
jgi:hypothetical protein